MIFDAPSQYTLNPFSCELGGRGRGLLLIPESPGPGQLAETDSESPDLMLFVIPTTDGSSDSQGFLITN